MGPGCPRWEAFLLEGRPGEPASGRCLAGQEDTARSSCLCCPWEVDRSARHIPRARCPWAPGSGLGMAPALCQPAAPMFSENLWLVLFSSVGLTVYASWFGAGGERGPGSGLWGAVFFAPFSAVIPELGFLDSSQWLSLSPGLSFDGFLPGLAALLGHFVRMSFSRNRISPSPWLPSAWMGGLVFSPGPGVWPVVATC